MSQQNATPLAAELHNHTATPAPSQTDLLHPQSKLEMDWERPSFEERDLCMEVTAYVYNWQQ